MTLVLFGAMTSFHEIAWSSAALSLMCAVVGCSSGGATSEAGASVSGTTSTGTESGSGGAGVTSGPGTSTTTGAGGTGGSGGASSSSGAGGAGGGVNEPEGACAKTGDGYVVLATGEPYPIGSVAVDDTNAYWPNGNAIRTIPRAGGPITTLAQGLDTPLSVAVDATHVYWSSYGDMHINRVPKGGGKVEQLSPSIGGNFATIAIDATNVYFGIFSDPFHTQLVTIPKAGGATTVLAKLDGTIGPLALEGGYVYFVDGNDNTMGGAIKRVATTGGSVETLATENASGWSYASFSPFGGGGLAVDTDHVYWMADGSAVKSMPALGGAVTTVVAGLDWGYHVATDGTSLYWSERGLLGKVPKAGGVKEMVAPGNGADGLALTAQHVYFTSNFDAAGSTIARACR